MKMCINRYIKGRPSRQKSLPKEALSLSLIAPGTDSQTTQLHLSRRLGGEGGRCTDKGGVLPTADSEKFRVITDILSSDEQGTAREGESGKCDTLCSQEAPGRQERWTV